MTARGQLALLTAMVVVGTGCAAAKSTFHIMQAERAIDNAEEQGADDLALYEYTMASRYLVKAREEHTYSSFRDSETLAKAAADYADQAIISMEERGTRASMDQDVDSMIEERQEAAPVEDITLDREPVDVPDDATPWEDVDEDGKPVEEPSPESEDDEMDELLFEPEDDDLDFLDEGEL